MVISQNIYRSLKCLTTNNDKVPNKPIKKTVPKRALFVFMSQIHVSSQDVSLLSFAMSEGQSLFLVNPSKIFFIKEFKFSCF